MNTSPKITNKSNSLETNLKSNTPIWNETDVKIIAAAYAIWNKVEPYVAGEDREKILDCISRIYQDSKDISKIDSFVSYSFFQASIHPNSLKNCAKEITTSNFNIDSEEAWTRVINLFTFGHTFKSREINTEIKNDMETAKTFLNYGVEFQSQYCINLLNELEAPNEFEILQGMIEEPSKIIEKPMEPKIIEKPMEPVKQTTPSKTPSIENTPVQNKKKRERTEGSDQSKSKKKEQKSPETNEKKTNPIVVIEAPKLPLVTENSLSEKEKETALKLINLKLKSSKIADLDWKWIALNKSENVEKIRAMWEQYLLESPNWKNSEEPILFYANYSLNHSSNKKIDWKWIAEGMKTKTSSPSEKECEIEWQQKVYDTLNIKK